MSDRAIHTDNKDGLRVSVALACYNGERYLPEMLASIVAQTRAPDEIVCSDDCSTDNTVAVLEEFAKTSPVPVRIIRQPNNLGFRKNFVEAFRATTGDVVAYCDQDDFWLENKIEKSLEALRRDEVALFNQTSILTDANLVETGKIFGARDAYKFYEFPFVATKMFGSGHQMVFTRRTANVLIDLYDDEQFDDSTLGRRFDDAIMFAASLSGGVQFSSEALTKFRRHEGTVSKTEKNVQRNDGFTYRMAARASRVRNHLDMLTEIQRLFKVLKVHHAINLEASKDAYTKYNQFVQRRVTALETKSLFQRIIQYPGIVASAIRENAERKDYAADLALSFFGAMQRS